MAIKDIHAWMTSTYLLNTIQSSSIFSSLYRVGIFGFIAGSDKIDAGAAAVKS